MSCSANKPRPLPVVNFTSQTRLVCSISTLGDKAHYYKINFLLSYSFFLLLFCFRSAGLTILGLNRRAGSRVTREQTSCTRKHLTLAWTKNVIASHRINRMAHIVSFQVVSRSQRFGLHVKNLDSVFLRGDAFLTGSRNVIARATGGNMKVQRPRINMGASRARP